MSRRSGFDALFLVVGLVSTAFVPRPVEAQIQVRFWINPAGGSFGIPSLPAANWSATDGGAGGATAPTTPDIAKFTLNNTYDVTFTHSVTNLALDIEKGNVTFDLDFASYTGTNPTAIDIGTLAGQTGRLTILNGTVGVDTAGDDVTVGILDGSTGFLTVSTNGQLGAAATRPDVFVGELGGTGTLTVQSDGEVFTREFTVGFLLGSTGTVTVTGPQASMDVSSTLTIGENGTGTMTVSNGADFVSAGTATLATNSGSTGTLTITGASSTWTQSTSMTVGFGGIGTLNVQSSGSLTTGIVNVGTASGGFGAATISSGGSASTQVINVGSLGSGTLTVTGVGSSLSTNGQGFTVGDNTGSEGDVTVSLGGTITAGTATLGALAGSRGRLSVSGSTSSFTSSGAFFVGSAGAGSLEVTSGATVNSLGARIAFSSGSTGSVTVSGTGSTWNAASLVIGGGTGGNGGAGTLSVSDGGAVNVSGATEIRSSAGTSLTVDGGTLNTGDFTRLGTLNFRNGMLHVKGVYDHGAAAAPLVIDGATPADLPTLRLSGNFAVNDVTTITVGNNNQGAVVLDSGRNVDVGTNNVSIGAGALSSGTITLSGNGTRLTTAGTLAVGGSGTTPGGSGTLTVGSGAAVPVLALGLFAGGVINLNGGSITATTFNAQGGIVNFNSGTFTLHEAIITDAHLDALLGAGHILSAGRRINTSSVNRTLASPLVVDGGTLNSPNLNNDSLLQIKDGVLSSGILVNNSGRLLQISGAGSLSASSALTNDGTIQLDNNLVATGGGTLTNNGTIRGSGLVGNNLTNNAAGQVQATAGNRLEFQGATNINSGSVSLVGGEIVFTGSLTNSASTGLISSGDAILRVNGGITNNGSLAVPFGLSHLFGDINNKGSVVVSGGALATFYDDITQDGTFRVSKVGSTTSTAVVLGDFTGGGSTGGGDIFFEGDLQPGNSAASITFSNNVAIGSGAALDIELGGATLGTQYDHVNVTGALSLDGALNVSLINGFTPSAGNTFDILDWGSLSGTFAAIHLPTLAGLEWDVSQLYSTGQISVVAPVFLAADFDEDGDVDGDDLAEWQSGFGTSGTAVHMDGDADGDQDVDGADFLMWQRQLGSVSSAAAATAAVPEPATMSLALLLVSPALRPFRRPWRRGR